MVASYLVVVVAGNVEAIWADRGTFLANQVGQQSAGAACYCPAAHANAVIETGDGDLVGFIRMVEVGAMLASVIGMVSE
ncbi:hypothetical protein D3C79_700370 [compost metagenome]